MATNTKKINLNQMLYNIDMANSKWYNTLDEEEKKTHLAERFAQTSTTFFKALLCLIFGSIALAQLYVIYLA